MRSSKMSSHNRRQLERHRQHRMAMSLVKEPEMMLFLNIQVKRGTMDPRHVCHQFRMKILMLAGMGITTDLCRAIFSFATPKSMTRARPETSNRITSRIITELFPDKGRQQYQKHTHLHHERAPEALEHSNIDDHEPSLSRLHSPSLSTIPTDLSQLL